MSHPRFSDAFPDGVKIVPEHLDTVREVLERADVAGHVQRVSSAGEGNMNLVLRVELDQGSVVLKQARPWVERFPEYPAPVERIRVEKAFYDVVASNPKLQVLCTRVLATDMSSGAIVLGDLGPGPDLRTIYAEGALSDEDLTRLLSWLDALHSTPVEEPARFANRDLRVMNHEHLFHIPYTDACLDVLDTWVEGLEHVGRALVHDTEFRAGLARLADAYLSDGKILVHGDFHPGSWIRTPSGVRVLDPEFAFMGHGAWDHGMLLAHLVFAHAPQEQWLRVQEASQVPALTRAVAGMEIARRLLGVARTPPAPSLRDATTWLGVARSWVVHPV